jgi:hypothetical protein
MTDHIPAPPPPTTIIKAGFPASPLLMAAGFVGWTMWVFVLMATLR